MKKRNKVMFLIYFLLIGLLLFISPNVTDVVNALDYVACGSAKGIPKPIPQMTTIAYTLVVVAGPLILIVSSIMTLIKSSSRNDAEEISRAKDKLLKKFLIAAILFLTSTIVQFWLNRVTSTTDDKKTFATCMKCFLYFSQNDCHPSESGNDIENGTYTSVYSNIAIESVSSGNLKDSYVPSKGIFFWPLPEPFGYDYIGNSRFGCRYHPIYYKCRQHSGTDIGVPHGTEILAALDGKATVYNQGSTGCGLFVQIEHEDGYTTRYCHMSSTAISGTQDVKMGEVIGYVGSTGDSTGDHLHFEIRKNGVAVNAMEFFEMPSSKMAAMSDYRCPSGC